MGSLFGDDEGEDLFGEKESDDEGAEKPASSAAAAADSADTGPAKNNVSHSVFLSSCIDGTIDIWDRWQEARVAHIGVTSGIPPWAMSACWSYDGNSIYVGRRNSCVEEFDLRKGFTASRNFKFPSVSGAVSAVKALPSNKHLLCASHDNLRLYDLNYDGGSSNAASGSSRQKSSGVPFYIIPGHHGGCISSIYVDPSYRYLITTSGNRGWQGNSTDVTLIYDINPM